MTNESKRQADEQLWRSFLQMYIERLKQEGTDDIERIQIMKQNNPRYENTRIGFYVENLICFQNGSEKLSCTTSY